MHGQLWNNRAPPLPRARDVQKLVYAIGGFVVLILLIGFALPGKSRFVVSIDIDAPQATVFALVNDMRRVNLWMPIEDTDPNAKVTYSGAPRGVGSTVTWDGAVVGNGAQTITESRAPEYVETWINRGQPGESRTWFELTAGARVTRVDWGFEHDYGLNVIGRYLGLLITGVIRRDYENSLATLKELAESLPATDFADIEIEHLVVEAQDIAYLPTTAAAQPGATSVAMGRALFEVLSFIDEHGLSEAGAPRSRARSAAHSCHSTPPCRCAASPTARSATSPVSGSVVPTRDRSCASSTSVRIAGWPKRIARSRLISPRPASSATGMPGSRTCRTRSRSTRPSC